MEWIRSAEPSLYQRDRDGIFSTPYLTMSKRDSELVPADNSGQSKPIIPFFVIMIILAVAIIIAVLLTICFWRSLRRARDQEPTPPPSPTPGTGGEPPPPVREIPTLVFQQHEPDTHGYFAPPYLDPAHNTGENWPMEEGAKEELRRIYDPEMFVHRLSRTGTDSTLESDLKDTTDAHDRKGN